jgi:hypothetical protein
MRGKYLVLAGALVAATAFAAALALATNGGGHAAAAKATNHAPGAKVEHIRVEGHWKLEVRNPDGTLVSVRRFHNDPANAAQAIATILGRAYSPGFWWITLGSSTGAGPACVQSGTPVFCRLFVANDTGSFATAANSFKTLVASNSNVQSQITLTGDMTAQRDGDVNTVASQLSVCSTATAPNAPCGTFQFWPFTTRTLGSPVSLVTGQHLLVTVTLTFT